ncbi:Non-SMC (structural maintenance of chromosomes) element 1 protein (NSE1) [Handroanthus impetiginosus]|uniref:Non-structural maintenance of chromosomes element 1 homolog n=1 Tax=Handroanthus impetiginosus TaxID=429701 RepID=A0A2G9HZ35_9LAMI|nr:Non-SMC (structural maintenance of chromosomes) element 1 protein (NSE1) [Handroanthus impetiginosus]
MPPLSWRHHTLIQALLSRGPLKEDEFRSIFSQVTGRTSGSQQQLFNEYLRKINAELSYVQFEMRACRNQYDGNVYYGVVNNVSDEQSKLGTKYSVPQIAFYKGIVEAIIQDAEARGCIFNTEALNIRLETQVPGANNLESQGVSSQVPTAFKNFSMSQKEKTLDQLIKDQWLCSIPVGKIGIGVRSFLDLRSWFRTNEVPACEVCNDAAVKAQLCQNEACNVRLHPYCLEKKFSRQRVERACPGCGTRWPGSSVAAEVQQEVEDSNDLSQNPLPPQPSMKRRRSLHQEANADVSEAHSSLTSASTSDTKRVTRRSARLSAH